MVLLYIQGESVDIWKKNIMENLRYESLEFAIVRDFLTDLKQEFGNRNNKLVKIAELKKVGKRSKTIKEFV